MATDSISLAEAATMSTSVMNGLDTGLRKAITDMPSNPDSADMISLQQAFQKWSLGVNLVINTNEKLSDTLRQITQKF